MQKGYRGIGMEGSIARWYDRTTRKDMPEFQRHAQEFDRMLPGAADILEVAPGPGFLSIELAKSGRHRVTGLDISKTFIGIAEMQRVLRPGGKGVIIDLRRDASMSMISTYVDRLGVNVWNGLFMKFIFRFALIRRAYTIAEFKYMLGKVPFKRTWIEANPVGLEAWFEK